MKLVDTSAWIEYLRGSKNETALAVLELVSRGEAAWCDIVAVELWNGVTFQQRAKLQRLEAMVSPLPISQQVWQRAKGLAGAARSSGKTAPVADIVIAACGQIFGLEIVHHADEHFDMLMKLNVETE